MEVREFRSEKKPSIFLFLARLQVQLFVSLWFRAQEKIVFAATCHTSITRLSKIFQIRFRGSFSASANDVWNGFGTAVD